MCGFAGYIGPAKNLEKKNKMMASSIPHRGPDDEGMFIDEEIGLALSFRRLSIQDLSENGHQPMESNSKRYVLVFNGEIYNFHNLRDELESKSQQFNGHSDTEVMLAAFEEWGIEKSLERFNGMFALALYDRKERTLTLARDRMGKKPLYLGWSKDGFYIASEMKAALVALPERPALNRDVAALYMHWRYIPDPYCIHEGFSKLSPGSYITAPVDDFKTPFDVQNRAKKFFNFEALTQIDKFAGDEEAALNELETRLKEATQRRMISDVPLGTFLSGGTDSALITALMSAQSDKPVRSFTIGFEDPAYNEAEVARQVAEHLKTEHTEVVVTAADAQKLAFELPDIFDEPFGDPSAIPTLQVCKLAKEHMTVALSGDGGDESFGGYSWYERARKVQSIPAPLRHMAAPFMRSSPQALKMASLFRADDHKELYANLHSYAQTLSNPLLNYEVTALPLPHDELPNTRSLPENLMAYDSLMFLPGDVLTKVDRTSMAVSLEVRSPLLDKEVVEFAWSLPPAMRRRKAILKNLLRRHLPGELIDLPKRGFSIPHGSWLRGDLSEWAGDLLALDSGIFNRETIDTLWSAHKKGEADHGHLLWTIVQFQSFYERWMK